jgi:hypothetical protein
MEEQKNEPVMIPKENHKPDVDIAKVAEEIKNHIDKKKMDHVDFDYEEIEMYPSPVSGSLGKDSPPEMPEFCKFCAQWEALFDYADKVTQSDGSGFPQEDIERFEKELKKVEKKINEDEEFWTKIRGEVMPIYMASKEYDKKWSKRWQRVILFYDPVGITVTTHKKMVNKLTGEVLSRELVHQREIPSGVVVRIK